MRPGSLALAIGFILLLTPEWTLAQALSSVLAQQQDVAIDPEYSCIVCHTDKRRAFLLGAHSERGIRCHDCHGD